MRLSKTKKEIAFKRFHVRKKQFYAGLISTRPSIHAIYREVEQEIEEKKREIYEENLRLDEYRRASRLDFMDCD